MYLSNRVQTLAESQTIAMARKSRDLAAQGVNIISLTLGEPDFNTPDIIKQAAKKAIDVLALDRVQKKLPIPEEAIVRLRRGKLIEGRKPAFHVSAVVAAATDNRAEYIRTRSLDDEHYKALNNGDYILIEKEVSYKSISFYIYFQFNNQLIVGNIVIR